MQQHELEPRLTRRRRVELGGETGATLAQVEPILTALVRERHAEIEQLQRPCAIAHRSSSAGGIEHPLDRAFQVSGRRKVDRLVSCTVEHVDRGGVDGACEQAMQASSFVVGHARGDVGRGHRILELHATASGARVDHVDRAGIATLRAHRRNECVDVDPVIAERQQSTHDRRVVDDGLGSWRLVSGSGRHVSQSCVIRRDGQPGTRCLRP